MEHCICWRQDAALTGTLEACRHLVEAAILAASQCGFQPRVPKADTMSNGPLVVRLDKAFFS